MSNYCKLKNTYEDFFVRYALNGSIADKQTGTRYGMPKLGPLRDSPLKQPSILNTKFQYTMSKNNNLNLSGVL
jgi:hypothetical protein